MEMKMFEINMKLCEIPFAKLSKDLNEVKL